MDASSAIAAERVLIVLQLRRLQPNLRGLGAGVGGIQRGLRGLPFGLKQAVVQA